jgi:hypothetical protein
LALGVMVVSVPDNPAMPAMMTGLWYAVRFGHFLILVFNT